MKPETKNEFGRLPMRWVKHMTATAQDEKIARLISEYGHAGYGLWWLVVEAVAARLEPDGQPSVTYPVTKWSHLLSLRGSHVRQALSKLEVTHLVTVEWIGTDIRVTIPNLLKYRDEYARKSGHTQESVRSKKQIQNTDTEAEIDKPQTPAPNGACSTESMPSVKSVLPIVRPPRKGKRTTEQVRSALGPERCLWFDSLWEVGVWKDGKLPGMDTYERGVHTVDLAREIHRGAVKYAAKCVSDPTIKVKFLQGWLTDERWTDENVIAAPKLSVEERAKLEHRQMMERNGTK